jgi:hypothetical protein
MPPPRWRQRWPRKPRPHRRYHNRHRPLVRTNSTRSARCCWRGLAQRIRRYLLRCGYGVEFLVNARHRVSRRSLTWMMGMRLIFGWGSCDPARSAAAGRPASARAASPGRSRCKRGAGSMAEGVADRDDGGRGCGRARYERHRTGAPTSAIQTGIEPGTECSRTQPRRRSSREEDCVRCLERGIGCDGGRTATVRGFTPKLERPGNCSRVSSDASGHPDPSRISTPARQSRDTCRGGRPDRRLHSSKH